MANKPINKNCKVGGSSWDLLMKEKLSAVFPFETKSKVKVQVNRLNILGKEHSEQENNLFSENGLL